ncbi:MAG: tetratricopeptide repeat protein [Candidatus Melainabacteria bacterium]|nr:tetratricopeptide repeat protein [Candidatus Melainabacteria bacterium]
MVSSQGRRAGGTSASSSSSALPENNGGQPVDPDSQGRRQQTQPVPTNAAEALTGQTLTGQALAGQMLTPAQPLTGQVSVSVPGSNSLEIQNANHRPSTTEAPSAISSVSGQVMSRQKVSLGAIVNDFKNTAQALGLPEAETQQLNSYLQVVLTEGAKAKPSVPLIRQVLRTSADGLDHFIQDALGQPSSVVKDWVEALLIQDIDYTHAVSANEASANAVATHTVSAGSAATPTVEPATDNGANNPASAPQTPPGTNTALEADRHHNPFSAASVTESLPLALSNDEKQALKTRIDRFQLRLKLNDWDKANNEMEQALALLAGKNRPDLEGKLHHLMGQFLEKTRRPREAIGQYTLAEKAFQQAQLPQKEIQAAHRAALLLEQTGQFGLAAERFNQALKRTQETALPGWSAQLLNDLGSVHLQRKALPQARQAFLKATQEAAKPSSGNPSLLPDIFSNLAAVYRKEGAAQQAVQAYRTSMQYARSQGNTQAYQASLQRLASLYLDEERPQTAMALLQLSQRFQQPAS